MKLFHITVILYFITIFSILSHLLQIVNVIKIFLVHTHFITFYLSVIL